MEVSAILVDDITLGPDGSTAGVVATLYEFAQPRWVTVHPERSVLAVGPLAFVEQGSPEGVLLPPMTTRCFGARSLPVSDDRGRTVSYRETWTTPENCVYTLVLPPAYVVAQLSVHREGGRYQPAVDVAATPDGRIFHYIVLMGERATLRVEIRIHCDEEAHQRTIANAATVAATRQYGELRGRLREGAMSADFWFKLLTLGGKLLGGP